MRSRTAPVLNLGEVLLATRGELRGDWQQAAFSRVVIDSRAVEHGCLFVAIVGQHHDGHAFVAEALAGGAAGAMVEHAPPADSVSESEGTAGHRRAVERGSTRPDGALRTGAPAESGSRGDHGQSGQDHDQGSRRQRAELATPGAQNRRQSEFGDRPALDGAERTASPRHEIAVLEMAMYQVGDIRHLARLARPRMGVVTAVLPVHLERLGTIERIQQAKQELVEELPSSGVAVLNGDDPRVASMATATSGAGGALRRRQRCGGSCRTDREPRLARG